MAWVKKGDLTGPQGPQGPKATTEEVGLAAHPVGSVVAETEGVNPTTKYGGTWVLRPSVGPFLWERKA